MPRTARAEDEREAERASQPPHLIGTDSRFFTAIPPSDHVGIVSHQFLRQVRRVPDDPLHRYPYVLVRIGCEVCQRTGRYRLARLAAKYGADVSLEDLLALLTADCGASNPRHPLHRECQARFIDLDPPRRPPDMPARRLRVVQGGRR